MVEFYSFSQDNAQNWANFKHYAEQNKLLKATVIVPKRVVFIGNSITEGWVILTFLNRMDMWVEA